nr:hypothetical protein GCM10020093_014270 [Planobispora longispora]
MTRFALALRETLLAHPGAVPLLLGSGFDGPNALAGGEALLDLLVRAGLPQDTASRASYLIITYILGTVALDAAELPPASPARRRRPHRRQARPSRRHPGRPFPRTAATADVVAGYNSTEQYLWGLTRLLDGILTGPPGRSTAS